MGTRQRPLAIKAGLSVARDQLCSNRFHVTNSIIMIKFVKNTGAIC